MKKIEDEKKLQVNTEAEFPGGAAAWQRFLNRNLRYPQAAIDSNVQGTVVVSFIIKTDGTTDSLEVISPVKGYFEEEAIRIIKKSKWFPALKNGVPIESRKKQPLIWTLESATE
jgi:protein TonB